MGIAEKVQHSKVGKQLFLNPSRVHLQQFATEASDSLTAPSMVLDAGAGDCCYKTTFDRHTYESADFCQVDVKSYADVTYVCDLSEIPVEDDRYDLVFCSQVLEHVAEPNEVLDELFRVLKPGGTLWLSAPLFFPEHEQPYDFYRYTQFGFQHVLTNSGFVVNDLRWLEGYFGTLSFQLKSAGAHLPLSARSYGGGLAGYGGGIMAAFLKPWFLLLSWVFARLDLRNLYDERGMCKNYRIVAQKPLEMAEVVSGQS